MKLIARLASTSLRPVLASAWFALALSAGCASEPDVQSNVENATDWGNGICDTNAGDRVRCGEDACAWDCTEAGLCEASCAPDEGVEAMSFTLAGDLELEVADADADCYLGELVDDEEQTLQIEFDDGERRLTVRVHELDGPGDYNVGEGTIGRVVGSFTDADGEQYSSAVCSVSLVATEDGGLATTGRGVHCFLTQGGVENPTAQVELEANFSCSAAGLWGYRR